MPVPGPPRAPLIWSSRQLVSCAASQLPPPATGRKGNGSDQHDPRAAQASSRHRGRHPQAHPRRGRPLATTASSLTTQRFSADRAGYQASIDWAGALAGKVAFAIEGTGSYGAGLTSAIRRLSGKSDTVDADNAARAVLGGHATAVPKADDGAVERCRQIEDIAVKASTAAMISLKQVLVNASPDLRERLEPATKMALIGPMCRATPRPGHDGRRGYQAHPAVGVRPHVSVGAQPDVSCRWWRGVMS